jgi:vacuolar-type H+-ATPase subunit E/Vma4
MSIERVKERILSKSKREAEAFLSSEKEKIEKEKEHFANQKKAEFEEKLKNALSKIENERNRELDQKELELDRKILSKKRAMIDELFEIALHKLSTLDKNKYKKFIESLILKDAPKGKSLIMVNKEDLSLFDDNFILNLNKKIGKGREISLSSETVSIKGGCIIRGNEVEIDDSIESLIADERESKEMSIAKSLFGEDK